MNDQSITDLMQAMGSKAKVAYTQIARAQAATKNVAFLSLITTHNFKDCCLFIRPDDVSIPVRVEPFDGLRTGLVVTLPSTCSG